MTRVTPTRLTILQCSHRALIDGRTFIRLLLFEPVGDAAAREVVRRQLDLDAVPGQDANEVHSHLAAHVREHPMAAFELHAEHRVRQWLHHGAFDLAAADRFASHTATIDNNNPREQVAR